MNTTEALKSQVPISNVAFETKEAKEAYEGKINIFKVLLNNYNQALNTSADELFTIKKPDLLNTGKLKNSLLNGMLQDIKNAEEDIKKQEKMFFNTLISQLNYLAKEKVVLLTNRQWDAIEEFTNLMK